MISYSFHCVLFCSGQAGTIPFLKDKGTSLMLRFLSPKQESFFALLLALYCLIELLISLDLSWGFTTDDAYISWFYARQLVQGKGLLWHVGSPPVEGYSNFLWMMISALIIKLNLPLLASIKYISSVSLFVGLFFLYRIGRTFFSPLLAMLAVFIFSHYSGVIWWTMSGLESTLYWALALLLIWQCLSFTASHATKSWIIVNGTLLLLSLTRFEGVVWIIPVALYLLGYFLKTKPSISPKQGYLWGLISLCCFIIPYLIYFIWRIIYFGHWIPNTYRCKALASGQLFEVNADYLLTIFPFIILSLPYFFTKKESSSLLLWLPSLLYIILLWTANPVIAYSLRLFLSAFALFTLLPVLGVYQFFCDVGWNKVDAKISTAFLIIFFTWWFISEKDFTAYHTSVIEYQQRTDNRVRIAELLNQKAKPGASVILDDCGIIPFRARADIHFIDIQCLNNPELTQAPYKNNLKRYADHLVQEIKPDWVIRSDYPLLHRGDYLIDLLDERHFFKDYQLVTTLTSGFMERVAGTERWTDDFVYRVYQRVPKKPE